MRKILSIAILSLVIFANESNNIEDKIIQGNIQKMNKMDKVDKEIRVLNSSIEKTKLSINKKFKEMEKIFDSYECEKQKVAIAILKAEIHLPEKILNKKDLIELKEILKRLKMKACRGK